jgi:hypothetical protein
MRFKAKLSQHQVSVIHGLLCNISKLGENNVTLQLDTHQLRILLNSQDSNKEHGIVVYAEFDNDSIFLDHKIESKSENNAITMLLDVTQLRLAFRTIVSTHDKTTTVNKSQSTAAPPPPPALLVPTVWKLAKRQNLPCLCLDGLSASNNIHIHQAVPVRLTPDHTLSVPTVPNFHDDHGDGDDDNHNNGPNMLQLRLPAQKYPSFKTLLERSKHSASVAYLSGTVHGELTVTVYTDSGCHVESHFRHLPVVSSNKAGKNKSGDTTTTTTTVKVDIRKLTACLHNTSSIATSCDLCLVENEMLILHSDTTADNNEGGGGAGRILYFVPVHYHVPGDHPCDNNE